MTEKKKKFPKYVPEVCHDCTQTKTYDLSLDRGSALIVLAIYNAVQRLDRNRIHLTDDMEVSKAEMESRFGDYPTMIAEGYMTSNMADNVLRAKYHGLVAQVDGGGSGEYLITPKGARFLKNEPMIRVAIIDKATHKKLGYWNEEDTVTFTHLLRNETPFWVFNEQTLAKIGGWAPPSQDTLGV